MATLYPGSQPAAPTSHQDAQDTIAAICNALGINPQGSAASVVARLNAIDPKLVGLLGTADTAWKTISSLGYTNGWADYDTVVWLPEYRKDAMGYVHLRGLIKNGTSNAVAFTMPVGYRPLRQELFTTWAGGAAARSDMQSDGGFLPLQQAPTGSTNAYVQLSGLTWLAEQ